MIAICTKFKIKEYKCIILAYDRSISNFSSEILLRLLNNISTSLSSIEFYLITANNKWIIFSKLYIIFIFEEKK